MVPLGNPESRKNDVMISGFPTFRGMLLQPPHTRMRGTSRRTTMADYPIHPACKLFPEMRKESYRH